MMPLQRHGAHTPDSLFNLVLNDAYLRHFRRGATVAQNEPGFVRALIARHTIKDLNIAAAKSYDPAVNQVFFRGGYLHARPYASFHAIDPNGGKPCRRELADALLIVYVTAPAVLHGPPLVVERAACLLMFKRDDLVPAKTPSFQPQKDVLPPAHGDYKGDSDKEQFYLFNQWPDFDLEVGSANNPTPLGSFRLAGGGHDIGKYAVVWKGPPPYQWQINGVPSAWLYAEPTPAHSIAVSGNSAASGSLAYLLQELVERKSNVGRTFLPTPPSATPGDWNELMSFLLGYQYPNGLVTLSDPGYLQKQKNYYKAGRDINPANMHFLGTAGPMAEWLALRRPLDSVYGLLPWVRRIERFDVSLWEDFYPGDFPFGTLIPPEAYDPWPWDDDALPVLIANVRHSAPVGEIWPDHGVRG